MVSMKIDVSLKELNWKGLFGGYCEEPHPSAPRTCRWLMACCPAAFYDAICNTRFLPLTTAYELLEHHRSLPTAGGGEDLIKGYLPFASNFQRQGHSSPDKMLLVNLSNGHCYVSVRT